MGIYTIQYTVYIYLLTNLLDSHILYSTVGWVHLIYGEVTTTFYLVRFTCIVYIQKGGLSSSIARKTVDLDQLVRFTCTLYSTVGWADLIYFE